MDDKAPKSKPGFRRTAEDLLKIPEDTQPRYIDHVQVARDHHEKVTQERREQTRAMIEAVKASQPLVEMTVSVKKSKKNRTEPEYVPIAETDETSKVAEDTRPEITLQDADEIMLIERESLYYSGQEHTYGPEHFDARKYAEANGYKLVDSYKKRII